MGTSERSRSFSVCFGLMDLELMASSLSLAAFHRACLDRMEVQKIEICYSCLVPGRFATP